MTFYILSKGYTVPGNHSTHEKLNQIRKLPPGQKDIRKPQNLFSEGRTRPWAQR